MYRKHFGLLRRPFELFPDSCTFYQGGMHREVLAGLRQGVAEERTFLLITGGAGAGKTALLDALLASLEIPGYLCLVTDPGLKTADFFTFLANHLGLRHNGNKAKFLVLFAQLLEECRKNGERILLIIDEAHVLPIELLEELRILANLATEVKSVFSILLAGEPELIGRLTQEQLFLLNQRIALRYHLNNFTPEECRQYILFRLKRAGLRKREVFSEKAGELIYRATMGNPRRINMLCDNALLTAYLRGAQEIDEVLVRECVERFHVRGGDRALPAEKRDMRKWLVWTALAFLSLEGAGVAYAYQKGWLMPVYQYLVSIKLG